jgi:hypothetical protein
LTVAALACAAVVAFSPVNASATPVLWNLNATVTGASASGTATGSFVYDADTNTYSSVAITTTLPVGSFSTNDIAGLAHNNQVLELIDNFVLGANAGKPVALLFFNPALTNLGGSASPTGFTGICEDVNCIVIDLQIPPNPAGMTVGGSVQGQLTGTPVVSTVPEPTTLVLCSAGLIGAGVRRWRQRRA